MQNLIKIALTEVGQKSIVRFDPDRQQMKFDRSMKKKVNVLEKVLRLNWQLKFCSSDEYFRLYGSHKYGNDGCLTQTRKKYFSNIHKLFMNYLIEFGTYIWYLVFNLIPSC